jgi:opacity protein-like surface antigen
VAGTARIGTDNQPATWLASALATMVWQNWSIKAEYDYIDFGTKTTPITGTVLPGVVGLPASVGLEDNLRIQQVKVGVNYRFLPNLW